MHPVQLMYGRAANLKGLYICIVGLLGNMAVRLYRICTNRDCGHKCSIHRLKPFGGNLDPVLFMYRRTAYFKYFELAMYEPILFVWMSI